ncbi:phage antirepressor KilAC domain-containing protein [Dethiothermospora halolimnae]|uniref:phage antirepressor KilAC domain-containing protein n=1 Tax=Dethiothermospora halolimnae TaxID=3114390 RepID=UPI003CCB88D1
MKDLQVQKVNFYGGEILGVRTEEGKVYMGVRKACMDIGLTRGQMNNEVKKIQEDLVLNKGARNLRYPTKGGVQEVLGIEKEFIPLWLAKISITPKMKKKSPETVERLVKYQLEAKDVLANAFVNKKLNSYMIDDPIERAKAWIKEQEEKKQLEFTNKKQQQVIGELKPKADYTDRILKNKGLVTITQIAKDYGMSGRAMNDLLHDLKVQFKQSDQWLLYSKYHGRGYTHSKTIDIVRSDGTPDVKMNTKWTQKGRLFLYNLLKQHGILPMIERESIQEIAATSKA